MIWANICWYKMTENNKVKIVYCNNDECEHPSEEALNCAKDKNIFPHGGSVVVWNDGSVFYLYPYIPMIVSKPLFKKDRQ